jgi:hypothetical protein
MRYRPISHEIVARSRLETEQRLPSEGEGHTFESCRVRQFFLTLQRDMRAQTETPDLPRSNE